MRNFIKLESNFKDFFDKEFYFNTMDDCHEFLSVFEDHWCNVPWKEPTYVDSCANNRAITNPKKKAKDELSWGFLFTWKLGIGKTKKQKEILRKLMSEM